MVAADESIVQSSPRPLVTTHAVNVVEIHAVHVIELAVGRRSQA